MIIRCLALLIPTILAIRGNSSENPLMSSGTRAQIPPQPIVTTSSACLNNCLQHGSLVFAAANLRNFQKIILNIDQFCNTQEQLTKCAQSCTDEEQQNLAQRTVLSAYICKDKLEEFRLVKECMEGQEIDYVNQCASDCGHPSSSTIQLDSSPAAAVNPFAFFDSITPVCRTIECIIKCSIMKSNKRCAGSGDLFKDIGFKQVMEASERLQNDIFNSSSSVAQQLAKIYLEALPEECAYVIDPVKYDTIFAEHEDVGSLVTARVSDAEGNTPKPSSTADEGETKATTTATFSANNEDVITRIFDVQIEPKSTESPVLEDTIIAGTEQKSEQEAATTGVVMEPVNEPDIPRGPSAPGNAPSSAESSDSESAHPKTSVQIQTQPEITQTSVEYISEQKQPSTADILPPAGDDESANKEETGATAGRVDEEQEAEEEDAGHESVVSSASDEATTVAAIQKLRSSTAATSQETERTIVVVNEENEHEIDTNTIMYQKHIASEQQKDLRKSGIRERITILLSLILPLFPLLLFNF